MKMTLVLLGVSHTLLAVKAIDTLAGFDDPITKIGSVNIYENIQQTIEKVGILIDIARLSIIISSLKRKDQRVREWIKRSLVIAIILFAGLCVTVETAKSINYYNPTEENDSMVNIIDLIYSYITNTVIIVCYLSIYITLRSHYKELTSQNVPEDQAGEFKATLDSVFILFVAICQVYLLRLVRDTMFFIQPNFRQSIVIYTIFSISKGLQTLGIVISLTLRIRQDILSKHKSENVDLILDTQSLEEIEEE